MASTSLAEQLKLLAAPQSSAYVAKKKTASLLFSPDEAAKKDRDTFYEIGLSGLNELIALSAEFKQFEDTLFHHTSKDFERAIQSKEANKNLDTNIEKFLLLLSPYFLLQSSHKAVEWLVHRYHIQEYNQDAIMQLILPYHETKIFIRFLQLLDVRDNKNKWNWLQLIQEHGVLLTRQMLYNECSVYNYALLKFICKMMLKYVKVFGPERASQINTVYAFYCSTCIGMMNTLKEHEPQILTIMLPTILKALDSPVKDFHCAGYVVLGFYASKTKFSDKKVFNEIVFKLFSAEITYETALLLNIMYTKKEYLEHIPEEILNNISPSVMETLSAHLNTLIAQNIKVNMFVKLFLKSVLTIMQKDTDEFRRFAKLPEILIEEVNLREEDPGEIILFIIDAYEFDTQSVLAIEESDGSDLEIVDEDSFATELQNWWSKLLQTLDRKYPDQFNKTYRLAFNVAPITTSKVRQKNHSIKRKVFSKLLRFKAEISHQVGQATLFEASYGKKMPFRVDAYKYVLKNFHTLKAEDPEFLKELVSRALSDAWPEVVAEALDTPLPYMMALFSADELVNFFMNIINHKNSLTLSKWHDVATYAVKIFTCVGTFPVNQQTVLGIMPYLFPKNVKFARTAYPVATSAWGKRFALTKSIISNVECRDPEDHDTFCKSVWNRLTKQPSLSFDFLDASKLDKNNLTDVCFYLLLKSHGFCTATAEDMRTSLNILLEAIEKWSIVRCENNEKFGWQQMNQMMQLAVEDKIMFEFFEYILERMIGEMVVEGISKPWCNYSEGPAALLVRQLYEICVTGCFIDSYSGNYSALLRKLFDRLFYTSKEKIEFIANFACGHILYAADPKDVISPELQLRSLVLIKNSLELIPIHKCGVDSEAMFTSLLFCLNNPLPAIRKTALAVIRGLIEKMSTSESNDESLYQCVYGVLLEHEEEMGIDHEQLPKILSLILNKTPNSMKNFKQDVMSEIIRICINAPVYVAAELLNVFSDSNNAKFFTKIVPLTAKTVKKLQINKSEKLMLNVYESKMIRNILGRLDENTAAALKNQEVWTNIQFLFNEYRECLLETDLSQISPAFILLKQISLPVFQKIPEERVVDVVKVICKAGALSGNVNLSSAAAKSIKKCHLNYEHFSPILQGMLNVEDPAQSKTKKSKSSVSMISYQLIETPEWKTGVAILEYIQSKKKMSVDNKFVLLLFQLLNRCLRFEEQSYVEYTKQLILSLLWFFCNNFVDNTDKDQTKALTAVFDIELVVQCIRNTQNPQTHHHALILLAHAATMLPEQVLHHTMEIFTFMGTSVLRHDDAYSFQIIVKIMETLVPVLIKSDGRQPLQARVVPVLRIFADAVLHVPEHRRLPLYKKLVDTVGHQEFLWVFLALLLETHVKNFTGNKEKDKRGNRNLAEQEAPMNRTDFGQNILLEFAPEACIESFTKLITYIKTLPLQKDEDNLDTTIKPSDIFSVNGHSALQLRHYKYVTITFMNSCLSSQRFVQHIGQATDVEAMEAQYKALIVNALTYIQSISKNTADEKSAKYWRVMLHHCYDLLDHANNLLSVNMFISVVRGLIKHNLPTVRRKAMELLNSKIQFAQEFFNDCDKDLLFSIMPALLDIVKTIETEPSTEETEATAAQELELNQQTALLSLKLLTRMLATENPDEFKPVLESITTYVCNQSISENVMASIVLCLAELCGNLKAHALASLWKYMPALIKVLKHQRQAETPELILLSTVTAVAKIVESLPLFLSPYLQKILIEYSILLSKWQASDQDCSKVSSIVSKLMNIKKKVATCIPPRVLIPVVNQTHQALLDKKNYDAIGPVMSVLAESFANVTAADFTTLQQDLVTFILSALDLRSDAEENDVDIEVVRRAEVEVVNALVCLVLKLSESNFRPFYFKVYDWAIRTNVEGKKDRAITFYRLSSAIAEKLKGLFVLFAGHFIKNASELLDACNNSKCEELYFDSEDKCIELVNGILNTLKVVFLYDSQNFMNKERFETLMQAIVDQLENTLGGIEGLKDRAKGLIIPCISQFAVATADDSLWKLLNYQILLKTRHNDAEIRLTALDCLVSMATQLGGSWLPLLAESVPFLAELLEDADGAVEKRAKEAIRALETVLGEPLEKYF